MAGVGGVCSLGVASEVYYAAIIHFTPTLVKAMHLGVTKYTLISYFKWETLSGDLNTTTPFFDVGHYKTKITARYRKWESWAPAMCICCLTRMCEDYVYLYLCSNGGIWEIKNWTVWVNHAIANNVKTISHQLSRNRPSCRFIQQWNCRS